jgi:hypothetical protein
VAGVAVYWLGPVGFQGELGLGRRGASFRLSGPLVVQPVDGTIDLTYIDLGLLARVQPSRTARARPFAIVGPVLSAKLSSTSTVEGESMDSFDVASGDLSLLAGVGIAFGPPRRAYSVELRYLHGTKDVLEEQDGAATGRSRVVLIVAGFEL